MSLRSKKHILIFVLLLLQGMAGAQSEPVSIEQYLSDRGMDDLLAEHLVEELSTQSGDTRTETAQELGQLYVRLLDQSATENDRRFWSERASNLLRLVPEADSPELRINLSKAAYMRAEAIAERFRLRMATEQEVAQAERVLRDTSTTFLEIAQAAHLTSQRLEKRLTERLDEDAEQEVTAALARSRQSRSLGFYYAGWSEYYLALITGDTARAGRALRHFGWLLNAREGDEASYDRLQPGLLRYEHVARSAIGAALACSLQGRSVEAVAWLDAVERSTDVAQEVRDQIVDRRIYVLAKAGMWADLELIIRRLRTSGGELDPIKARILVVTCMEALSGPEGRGRSRELIRRLSDTGLSDLVAEGEVGHVLELVRAFGTESLGDHGFVVLYVKGLLAMDAALRAREAAGDTGEGPVADPAIAAMYRSAATQLLASVDEPDASLHEAERVRAMTSAGSAFYLSGDTVLCVDILERAIGEAESPDQAEAAHWLAVVALDDSVESGDETLKPRRDQLATLYLSVYAGTDRAARLLMRPSSTGLLPDDEAVEILLSIQPTSPNFLAARRQASQLLYKMYRQAPGSRRTFAAQRFVEVASQLIRQELLEVRSGDVELATRASESILLRARQVADASLGTTPADIERATFALDTLDRVASFASIDTQDLAPEIAFRRLQIASAQRDHSAVDRWFTEVERLDGGFLASAQRILYRDAVAQWIDNPSDIAAAKEIVRQGKGVIEQFSDSTSQQKVLLGVLETSAQAAGAIWELERDPSMLESAIAFNERLIQSGAASGPVLKRQARLLERANRNGEALEIWRRLVAGLDPEESDWYEARYESIRLLFSSDSEAARTAMRQHITLYPDLGPSPWNERFRELARSLNVEVAR
ncbi:MAG: hypothetical protein KDA31_09590 [Phycisphaerales bacterium]|nr:hypothetical protein [Phycisphaerales bacterium]MCB9836436.1 hypothetical protein [Phycisphaera sp.]